MRFLLFLLILFITSEITTAQQHREDLEKILILGMQEADLYGKNYMEPGSKALISTLSNAWYNSGQAKSPGKITLSLKGNTAFIPKDDQSFAVDLSLIRHLEPIGSLKEPMDDLMDLIDLVDLRVSTILGNNDPGIHAIAVYEEPDGEVYEVEMALPYGLGHSAINFVPVGFAQAEIGVFKGTELKVRFIPKVKIKGFSSYLYGAGIQHELTSWLDPKQNFPLHFSILAGYTRFHVNRQPPVPKNIESQNRMMSANVSSWLLTSIISTNFDLINFYGGLGYYFGKTSTRLKGTYKTTINEASVEITNPVHIENQNQSITGTLGASIRLGRLLFNVDHNFQNPISLSGGISFTFN